MASSVREVDIIIGGGGTAGCILAARLAKADPSLEILVVEAGGHTKNDPKIVNPALNAANFAPTAGRALVYPVKPSEHLLDRPLFVLAGGCLGGGSSMNLMMYNRGLKVDYDAFNTPGWNFDDDLLPLFKKHEHFHYEGEGIDPKVHGYEGELHVSDGKYIFKDLQDAWLKAFETSGVKVVADGQNFTEGNAAQRQPKWINPKTGKRQDVPHQFIYPLLDSGKTKLEIQTDSKVKRVLFEGTKASGVEYVPKDAPDSTPTPVHARKLVVLAAGALSSPQILERSGVGSAERLSKLNIPLVADVQGVGTNYQDHPAMPNSLMIRDESAETMDRLFTSPDIVERMLKSQASDPDSEELLILGASGVDIGAKLRPTPEEVAAMGSQLQEIWEKEFKNSPTKPFIEIAANAGFVGDRTGLAPGSYISAAAWLMYPHSRGSIHITGTSLSDPPDFDSGILSHQADLDGLIWAYKKLRSIWAKVEYFDKPNATRAPIFSETSRANNPLDPMGTLPEGNGVGGYTKEDDEAIEKYVRTITQSVWHSSGTCAMKPLQEGGTVDKDLNVYGVSNLKVADLSILPNNVGCNTYSTALMVGEKAATIIAAELGIKV